MIGIDTGAAISVIDKSVYDRIPFNQKPRINRRTDMKAQSAGRHRLDVIGSIYATIRIGNTIMKGEIVVVDRLGAPILIGNDLIIKYDIRTMGRERYISISGHRVPCRLVSDGYVYSVFSMQSNVESQQTRVGIEREIQEREKSVRNHIRSETNHRVHREKSNKGANNKELSNQQSSNRTSRSEIIMSNPESIERKEKEKRDVYPIRDTRQSNDQLNGIQSEIEHVRDGIELELNRESKRNECAIRDRQISNRCGERKSNDYDAYRRDYASRCVKEIVPIEISSVDVRMECMDRPFMNGVAMCECCSSDSILAIEKLKCEKWIGRLTISLMVPTPENNVTRCESNDVTNYENECIRTIDNLCVNERYDVDIDNVPEIGPTDERADIDRVNAISHRGMSSRNESLDQRRDRRNPKRRYERSSRRLKIIRESHKREANEYHQNTETRNRERKRGETRNSHLPIVYPNRVIGINTRMNPTTAIIC